MKPRTRSTSTSRHTRCSPTAPERESPETPAHAQKEIDEKTHAPPTTQQPRERLTKWPVERRRPAGASQQSTQQSPSKSQEIPETTKPPAPPSDPQISDTPDSQTPDSTNRENARRKVSPLPI